MYASLYPSIIRQFNIAPHTQIGMLIINKPIHDKENRRKLDNWTRASAFMEDFQSQVWLEINSRWFHLADFTMLYHEVEAFFQTMMNASNGLSMYNRDGLIIPMIDEKPNMLIEPMEFFQDNRRPVEDIYVAPNFERMEEWRNAAIKTPNQRFE